MSLGGVSLSRPCVYLFGLCNQRGAWFMSRRIQSPRSLFLVPYTVRGLRSMRRERRKMVASSRCRRFAKLGKSATRRRAVLLIELVSCLHCYPSEYVEKPQRHIDVPTANSFNISLLCLHTSHPSRQSCTHIRSISCPYICSKEKLCKWVPVNYKSTNTPSFGLPIPHHDQCILLEIFTNVPKTFVPIHFSWINPNNRQLEIIKRHALCDTNPL